jgi:two-component system OmpR family sensor kinase
VSTRRLLPLSIHTRLTLWYAGAMLVILVLISAGSYSLLAWNMAQDVDRSLLTVADVMRDAAHGPDSVEATERWLREVLDPDHRLFQLYGPDGDLRVKSSRLHTGLVLSSAARSNVAQGRATFETVDLNGHWVRVVTVPVRRGERLIEVVQVGASLKPTAQTLQRWLETLLILVPLGVGLAAAGGYIMARAALRPVDEMSSAARRIDAEALARRIAVRGTGDELDRLADTLNGMLARLENTFTEMRRFSADAAHELRSPLTALKGTLEVTLRADRSGEEYRAALVSALEEVERLIRLAEDLLLLSRSTAGPESPRARVDLEPLVLEVADTGARLGKDRSVVVRVDPIAPLAVLGDVGALRRAVLNLVENGVKYTPPGGRVEVSVVADGADALIAVEDTGPGIEAADATRIFEAFVRLDAARARETGGSGLGLAIARSIVVAHRGTIAVDRAAGGGARFTIRLPRA